MLVLVPTIVVVMDGSELISSPFKFQVIVIGSSPCEMEQASWAKAPSSTTSEPNENGTILGGSERENVMGVIHYIILFHKQGYVSHR